MFHLDHLYPFIVFVSHQDRVNVHCLNNSNISNVYAAWQRSPTIQLVLYRTIFSQKKNKESCNKWSGPSQNPYLNIIESVWDHTRRQKTQRQTKSPEELWHVLKDAWDNPPAQFCEKLCTSQRQRVVTPIYWFSFLFNAICMRLTDK